MSFDCFLELTSQYASVYKKFEDFQKDEENAFIPKIGDQKTGLIGEALIYQYLLRTGLSNLKFGGTSEKGWDISSYDDKEIRYQVKTVSHYSKTRTISPIHNGWNKLYLVLLNESFIPKGLWLVENNNIDWKKCSNNTIKDLKMKIPDNKNSGSPILFENAVDCLDDFKNKFPEIYSEKKILSCKD